MDNYAPITNDFTLLNINNSNKKNDKKLRSENKSRERKHIKNDIINNKIEMNHNKKDKMENENKYKFELMNNSSSGYGRGFGNLNTANDIRNGNQSRIDTKDFKMIKESRTTFDHQFQYLDRNYQDPNNIVLPFPRGGDQTRDTQQLKVDTIRNTNVQAFTYDELDFKY